MRLRFWGVRGSTPTPQISHLGHGGNTACVEVRSDYNDVLILDGGSGLRNLGQALSEEFRSHPMALHLFLTHFHWDHIQGVPFFLPLYNPLHHVTFYASRWLGRLEGMLQGQMSKPYFPVSLESMPHHSFVELDAGAFRVGGFSVCAFPLHHPQGAYGYRIETSRAAVVYATDFEHGDREMDATLRDHARRASVLIFDSQYTPEEYPAHAGWGHSTWLEATRVAQDADVGQLILFHHDPWHDDRLLTEITGAARKEFENTIGAAEGWSADL